MVCDRPGNGISEKKFVGDLRFHNMNGSHVAANSSPWAKCNNSEVIAGRRHPNVFIYCSRDELYHLLSVVPGHA